MVGWCSMGTFNDPWGDQGGKVPFFQCAPAICCWFFLLRWSKRQKKSIGCPKMLTWSGDDVIWYAIPHLVSWSHSKIKTTSNLRPGFVQKIGTGLALLDLFDLFDFDLFHWNMAWRPPWVHRFFAPWSFQWRGDAAMLTKNRAEIPERVRRLRISYDFIWFHKSRGQILFRLHLEPFQNRFSCKHLCFSEKLKA